MAKPGRKPKFGTKMASRFVVRVPAVAEQALEQLVSASGQPTSDVARAVLFAGIAYQAKTLGVDIPTDGDLHVKKLQPQPAGAGTEEPEP